MKNYQTQLLSSLINITIISLLFTILNNSSTKKRIYETNSNKSTSLQIWDDCDKHKEFTSDLESKHYYFINNNNHKIHARLFETIDNDNDNDNPFVVFFHGIGSHINRYITNSKGSFINI